ncbi:DNA/RNA nuclease SfsA [Oceanobacillus halophilus]|uniref:Sugar fermentation stimulation protein homolog n=1 Tax=Oceanobacillus halophilus TaxID=930130 RepID=A0A494ZR34_9BACI|nr:DNA/RNA nuclease SfsA [Oceanobacillus halophilus]RKQ28177.1 DNA/RNA nuclease SfsA [Oceanobacillus halophilus]
MKYGHIVSGKLNRKVNRFIAEVFIEGVMEEVHIKNTGRLIELLVPGAEVLLEESNNPKRKTKYSLIAVWKNGRLVNIDSQVPNPVAFDAVKDGKLQEIGQVERIKREVTYGNSRMDLYYEKKEERGFIEVKGVTLEKDGLAMFPDAPTKRGKKHVLELAAAVKEGYKAMILFIIQMKGCHSFTPHVEMDQEFARALHHAYKQGVQILAYDTVVTEDEIVLGEAIPVIWGDGFNGEGYM